MSFVERAFERLYEDEGLTDELTDEEAKPLLKWAEDEIMRLDAEISDEEVFDDKFKLLRRTVKRINSFVAGRSEYDDEKAQNVMARFTEGLYELGYEVNQAPVNAFLSAQANMDNLQTVQAMLGLIAAGAGDTAGAGAVEDLPAMDSLDGDVADIDELVD